MWQKNWQDFNVISPPTLPVPLPQEPHCRLLSAISWPSTPLCPTPVQAHLGGTVLHQNTSLGYVPKSHTCTKLRRQTTRETSLLTLWPHPYGLCVQQPRYSTCLFPRPSISPYSASVSRGGQVHEAWCGRKTHFKHTDEQKTSKVHPDLADHIKSAQLGWAGLLSQGHLHHGQEGQGTASHTWGGLCALYTLWGSSR